MGARWNGIDERPIDGMWRLKATSTALLGLLGVSAIACSLMVLFGTSPFVFILAWLPIIIYLFLCSVWARALPGYVVWRSYTVDRVWARFWLDDGNMGIEIESKLGRELIPFRKECQRSYVTH